MMLAIKPASGKPFLRTSPELENEIGEKPCKLLLQIDYWIRIGKNFIDGKWWTYQSTRDIQEKAFPGWALSTINRAIQKLEKLGLIEIGNYNKAKYDKTRWFAIKAEGLAQLKSIILLEDEPRSTQDGTHSAQNGTRSTQNDTGSAQNGTTIPTTPTKISALNTSSTPAAAPREDAAAADQSDSTALEKVSSQNPMQPLKVQAVVKADDIQKTRTPADSPIPPVAVAPLSLDCPEDDDLKAFFNGCSAKELAGMVKTYGRARIQKIIDEVRLLPNVDNPPGLVRTKLRSEALGAWKWPKSAGANYAEKSGADYLEGDYAKYITGPYANVIKH